MSLSFERVPAFEWDTPERAAFCPATTLTSGFKCQACNKQYFTYFKVGHVPESFFSETRVV